MGAVYAWENAAEASGAQIDVSSEALGLGVRSLLTPQIQDVWRSGAWTGTINLNIDLGVSRSDLRIFAIAAPRNAVLPSAAAQVRLVASDVAMGSADALNAGLIPLVLAPHGLLVWLLPAAITARYLQWRLVAGPADTYIQLGRVWAGPALVTGSDVAPGLSYSLHDASTNDRAGLSGVRYGRRGSVRRAPSWSHQGLIEDDAKAMRQFGLEVGTYSQILAAPFSGAVNDGAILGQLSSELQVQQSSWDRWTANISIDEDC